MKIRIALIFLLFLVVSFTGHSQSMDSLRWFIKQPAPDTLTARRMARLGYFMRDTDADSAKYFCDQALLLLRNKEKGPLLASVYQARTWVNISLSDFNAAMNDITLAQKIIEPYDKPVIKNKIINTLGVVHYYLGNYDSSIVYYEKSFIETGKIKDYALMAGALQNIAMSYRSKGENEKSINRYMQSLYLAEKVGDKYSIAASYNNIALIYEDLKDFQKAISYYKKAAEINSEIGNTYYLAINYNNMGAAYSKIGKDDFASMYYTLSDSLYKTMNNLFGIVNVKIGQASMDIKYKRLDAADVKLREALEMAQKGNLTELIKEIYLHLGELEFQKGKYKLSLSYFEKIDTGFTTNTMIVQELELLDMMRKAAEKSGELAKAYRYLDRLYGRRMKMLEQNSNDIIADKLIKYDTEKKELALEKKTLENSLNEEQIKNERIIKWISLGVLLIVAVFGIMILVLYLRKKKDNKIIAAEKQKSEELLLNILPSDIADELKLKGSSDARFHENVSILFTDFKGFTQLSEKLSPAELVAEIDYCFKRFDQIITHYGIEKIKTIGDAYMAVSGLPLADPAHAEKMVSAALDIRDFMHKYKEQRDKENRLHFELRLGIHSGEVVAGIVGVKKFAYDVWGDAVNTAARMESSGEVGKINISETTYELVKDKFSFTYRGDIEAKGKGKMKMYFVERKL